MLLLASSVLCALCTIYIATAQPGKYIAYLIIKIVATILIIIFQSVLFQCFSYSDCIWIQMDFLCLLLQ